MASLNKEEDEPSSLTSLQNDHGNVANSEEAEEDSDDDVDALLAESMALTKEATEALRRTNGPIRRFHALESQPCSPPISNDPNYPDLQLSSDTSSPPDSSRSHIDKVDHQIQAVLDPESRAALRTDSELGDRVMSRRSTREATPIENMFPKPPSPWVERLNSATMDNDCGMLSASSTFDKGGSSLQRFSSQNLHHPRNEHDEHDGISDDESNQIGDKMNGLFQYIDAYKPQEVEIPAILKPFIPDYILPVGAIDQFIKVPRPDDQPDYLGLKVHCLQPTEWHAILQVPNESGAKQSDPAVLTLQPRAASNQPSLHLLEGSSIENAHKNPKKLDAWISSIKDLHRAKPPPSVIYSKAMPEMERLLQEWPPEIEKVLADIQLPTAKLDVDLPTFVDICCSVLDIPVYKSRVESLHVMFSLYLELKNSMPQFSSVNSEFGDRI